MNNLPLLQCKGCNDILNEEQPIQHCNICNIDLCNKCGDNHTLIKTKS